MGFFSVSEHEGIRQMILHGLLSPLAARKWTCGIILRVPQIQHKLNSHPSLVFPGKEVCGEVGHWCETERLEYALIHREMVSADLPEILQLKETCVLSRFSGVRLFATLWTVAHRLLCPWGFSWLPFLLQGIFPTQGSSPVSYVSCTDRRVLYQQRHLGSPN